jgi:hypothetical protein
LTLASSVKGRIVPCPIWNKGKLTVKKLILAVSTVALAGGSALAQAPLPHRLTGAEVCAAHVGNMAYAAGRFAPKTIATYFAPEGQARLRSPDVNDTATYRTTDYDMYCSKYQKYAMAWARVR